GKWLCYTGDINQKVAFLAIPGNMMEICGNFGLRSPRRFCLLHTLVANNARLMLGPFTLCQLQNLAKGPTTNVAQVPTITLLYVAIALLMDVAISYVLIIVRIRGTLAETRILWI
ncbi:MAG: hypothetical protein JXA37_13370, partial [Chloroflexia bacterium]|nr:hypothetical protein [Chloroflexia bacterium]